MDLLEFNHFALYWIKITSDGKLYRLLFLAYHFFAHIQGDILGKKLSFDFIVKMRFISV